MRRAPLTKEKQGGFYQNKGLKSWIFKTSIYAIAKVAFITARIIAYLQYLTLNMQRDMQKADLWMTLWHTFSCRSNKAMRWLALISFKSLNMKIKSFKKCLTHWEKNNQFTFLTRLRVIAETLRAQYRSIYAHSFSPTLPISFSFFFWHSTPE